MPKKEDYRILIEAEWKDIHHSRIQEWSALGAITAIHFGLLQLVNIIRDTKIEVDIINTLIVIICIVAIMFAAIGVLMVCRHRGLMWIKLNWIYEAEEKLGLIKTKKNKDGIIPYNYKLEKILRGYDNISNNKNILVLKNLLMEKSGIDLYGQDFYQLVVL